MEWYPWLTSPYQQMIKQYETVHLHHALLFQFIKGNGHEFLVKKLIQRLLCLLPLGDEPCEKCHSCNMVTAGTHPDFHHVSPENDKSTIGVDAIRQVSNVIYEHAQQGYNKVIWLERVERLTESASNALLKSLEEPPKQTYFILSCFNAVMLLPTIRSRCIYQRLSTLDSAAALQWITQTDHHQHDQQQLITALKLCANAPLSSLALLSDQSWQERNSFFQTVATAMQQQDIYLLIKPLNSGNSAQLLYWFLSLITDVIKFQLQLIEALNNQDQIVLIRQFSRLPQTVLWQIMDNVSNCYRQLAIAGINNELLLVNLLVEIESLCFDLNQ